MASSVRSFSSAISTVLPYTSSVSSGNGGSPTPSHLQQRFSEIHSFFLWFHKDERLERQYRNFYVDRQIRTMQRLYIALGIVAAIVLGLQIAETSSQHISGVCTCAAFIVLCPVFLFLLSLTSHFRRYFSVASVLCGVVICICFIRITIWNGSAIRSNAVVVYLFCLFSFLSGLHFPEVLLLHTVLTIDVMIEWTLADFFENSTEILTTLLQFTCTGFLFAYASYRQDYLYRRVFISTYQLRTDNKDLRSELTKLKPGGTRTSAVDLDSPIVKIVALLKDVRQSVACDPILGKETLGRLDVVIDQLIHNNDIFSPVISTQLDRVDLEIQKWLFEELASKEKDRESRSGSTVGEIPSRRPSIGGVLKRRRSSSGMRGLGLPPSLRPSSEVSEINPDDIYSITSFLETHIDQWDFDVFLFTEKCKGRPLYHLGHYLFKRYQLFTKFDIDPSKFDNFVNCIESGYHPENPYHNSTHATGCHQLISCSDLLSSMDDIEILSLFLAAIVHDVDHPGRTNIFMVNTESEYALTYNDKSVLENHHSSTAFRIIRDPKSNILENFSKTDRKVVRSTIIDLVLATDLSMHFDIVGKFKSKLDAEDLRTNKDSRNLILKIVIKCADVSNPAKIESLYLPWVQRIMTEFYIQGDEEAKMSIPISPFMDRNSPTVEKCQCGFMDFIVRPLFDGWCSFSGDQSWAHILDSNKKYFSEKLAALAAPVKPLEIQPAPTPSHAARETPVVPVSLPRNDPPSAHSPSEEPSEQDGLISVPSTPPMLPNSVPEPMPLPPK